MRTPPTELPEEVVLRQVRAGWDLDVGQVEHLPWGFGAWHWAVSDSAGRRSWFVTADRLAGPGRLAELEQAYTTARELSRHLPAVASLPAIGGAHCREVDGLALSVAPWTDGQRDGHGALTGAVAEGTAAFLAALHAAPPPRSLPIWDPQYASHQVLDGLAALVGDSWESGPFADEARNLVAEHLVQVDGWRRRYAALADRALIRRADWVVTHGEPGPHNQIHTPDGVRWVDWESVRLAPRERDLTVLTASGTEQWQGAYPQGTDPDMLEMFDLAWRLDEIGQYTEWFRRPHTGTEDDRIALAGLCEELTRVDWPREVARGRP